MVTGTLAFLLGIILVQQLPQLPSLNWLAILLPLATLSWLPPLRRYHAPLLSWCVMGFIWAWAHGAYLLRDELPAALEGVDVIVEGVVASIPDANAQRQRFLLDCESLRRDTETLPCPGRLRLSWYRGTSVIEAGQRWRLQVRLKRPHGMVNPGGFDYEGWLFQQHIRATGYVRAGKETVLLAEDSGRYRLQGLRQELFTQLQTELGEHTRAGLVTALTMGERQGIDQAQWQILRATGTNHLVAISGLHIGIVAGLVFFVMRRFWTCAARLTRYLPAPKAAAIFALLAALVYAALAGFSIPTQRALIMVGVVMLTVIGQRAMRPTRTLTLALALVMLLDPLAVLSPGFWLSFGAVAVILYGMGGRIGNGGLWWRWGRAQWVVALGLAPLLALWFQQVPLIGPLANLLAVPWVTLVVVPLVLAGVALLGWWPALAGLLFKLALLACDGLWWWLQWAAEWLPAQWGMWAPPAWTVLPAIIGLAWLLAPRGWPARWVGALWLLPLVLARPAVPSAGELWLTQLDVGQGLAVLLRTANHTLLFDTGPRFGDDLDAGEAVIVPYLRQQGITWLDILLLSHGDIDHVGGTGAVIAALPVRRVLAAGTDLPIAAPELCRQGERWQWDGVWFEVLHPPADKSTAYSDNNGACVLRVETAHGSALLAADIEASVEAELLAGQAGKLRAEVLLVPHHGSRTSSTADFVQAVSPRYVLFATGYRNRYHFPHPAVVARYREAGADLFDSASSGALTLRLGREHIEVKSEREQARRYWFSD